MPSISASSYAKFRTCPRLYYWEHVLYFERAREDGARRFGTMYHAGMEAWWRTAGDKSPWLDHDEPLVSALKAIAENAKHVATDPFEVARAESMMVGYHARYYHMEFESPYSDSDGVELFYDLPLLDERGATIPNWRVKGRKDVVKKFPDGRTKVVEHKTTSAEIHGGSDYWIRLAIDAQCSMYVDAAQQEGLDVNEVLYDVSRKPGLKPQLATPEEKKKYTKGKGCTNCGGRAGGKLGVAQGTGKIMVEIMSAGKKADVETKCNECDGTGWKRIADKTNAYESPRLHADQRLVDETPQDFRLRVGEEIREDVDAVYRQGIVKRSTDQLMEMRADLVVTTGEIGALVSLARNATRSGELGTTEARRCFPRNTNACTSIYGRRCDFIDVCAGIADPWQSPLYQIKTSRMDVAGTYNVAEKAGR